MSYTQFTQEERYQIYILKKVEYNLTQIAGLLERDKSTISRELRRNRGLKGYRPQQAHNNRCIPSSGWSSTKQPGRV